MLSARKTKDKKTPKSVSNIISKFKKKHNKSEIIEAPDNKWLQLRKELVITDDLPNNELIFYTHNPGEEAAFFEISK